MIDDFINALALTNEKFWFYLDTATMTIVKNRSTLDGVDVPYLARTQPDRLLPLPNKKEIHTYAIMEDYIAQSPRLRQSGRDRLRTALNGQGPFKRFRDEARKLGLEEDWLKYRDERFETMALEWCEEHHIDPDKVEGGSARPRKPSPAPASASPAPEPDDEDDPILSAVNTAAGQARRAPDPAMTIALIESIRELFRLLDDDSFENALDHLVASIRGQA